jgi:hypothetical protein
LASAHTLMEGIVKRWQWRVVAALAVGLRSTGSAQTVLIVPGKTVEVLGLHRWSLQMLQDSMSKYAPGESLASHACAAVLRYKLGFAEASSTTYVGFVRGDTIPHVVVAVVEPQDSSRVRHRVVPMDSTTPYAPWAPAVEIAAKAPRVVEAALTSYFQWRRDSAHTNVPAFARRDSAQVLWYWRFLAAHRAASDFAQARRMLLSDADYRNRTVAASLLVNFLDRDSTWYAAIDAIREVDGQVKTMGDVLLRVATKEAARPIDWVPADTSLRAILDGTSLFQLPVVIDALLATGVGPQLASPLLKNGGRALLSFVGAQHPAPRGAARRLLIALAGRDLGDDANVWKQWINSL